MGAKSSPARSQEARAKAKADRRSGGPAGAPCRAHRQGLPKVWAEICSQPNQSAISGSFFGTKLWKCAESDDGNPKKSMILHRMVPSVSAKSVLLDLSHPPAPKQRVLAPLQDAEGAAGGAVHAQRLLGGRVEARESGVVGRRSDGGGYERGVVVDEGVVEGTDGKEAHK